MRGDKEDFPRVTGNGDDIYKTRRMQEKVHTWEGSVKLFTFVFLQHDLELTE